MPERKHKLYRKVDSEEVQGEGSWVVLKSPTLDDIRNAAIPPEGDQAAAFDFGVSILKSLVKEWNWVDDDGDPLPEPSPEIVESLPAQEIMFLLSATELDKLTDQKN